jgi:Family of unknown function (DUF5681)
MDEKANNRPTQDYLVGFGRPPREHNFQKGTSGNPKGRPRKDKETALLAPDQLKKLLEAPIRVQKNGVSTPLSPIEARLLSVIKKALTQQNITAIKYILDRAFKYKLLNAPQSSSSGGVVVVPRMEGIPQGMEWMLAMRFGIPHDGKWLPHEIEAVRPHFEFRNEVQQ